MTYSAQVVGIYKEMAWSAVRGYRSMVDTDADSLVVSLMMPIVSLTSVCGTFSHWNLLIIYSAVWKENIDLPTSKSQDNFVESI